MNSLEQIIYNIVGGALVSLLTILFAKLGEFFRARKFKNIFGLDASKSFDIVYGVMRLLPSFDKNGEPTEWPYFKPDTIGTKFRISSPVSAAEMRAAKYISEVFAKNIRKSPVLVPDLDVKNRMDFSFCSVGGLNNLKTLDILDHHENIFFTFDPSQQLAIAVKNESGIKFVNDGSYDYGFIIKLAPSSLQNRTWISIAGLGEWGTSGAAWFLARNWKRIEKDYNNKPFGLIVKVKGLSDESAELIYQSA